MPTRPGQARRCRGADNARVSPSPYTRPLSFEVWSNDPALYAPPQGETGLTLVARVRPAVDCLVARHASETIVVVAHKTVNRLLICSLFNIPLKHYRWVVWQEVACLNVLNFVAPDAVSLIKLNDTSHYE